MIRTIQFTGNRKDDYIIEKKYKEVMKPGVSEKDALAAKEKYSRRDYKYKQYWDYVEDGYKNEHLVKNLLNRVIEFAPDKINVLFGPNASGKTTIIKAIAAHCMCGQPYANDGFTSFTKFSPHNINTFSWDDEDYDKMEFIMNSIRNQIHQTAGNDALVDWDGSPTYYENTSGRHIREFGDAQGGLIQDGGEEMMFLFGRQKSSAGQMSIWMINKLMQIAMNPPTIDMLRQACKDAQKSVNETWERAYKGNTMYYDSIIKKAPAPDEQVTTILLDEMDKSLGITNVIALYRDALPRLLHSTRCQPIIVSHSPIILTDNIFNNDDYHIISLVPEYTEACREELSSFKFK